MYTRIRPRVVLALITASFVVGCQSKNDAINTTQKLGFTSEQTSFNAEELEVISAVDNLLVAVGNSDLEALNGMVSDKANLGITSLKNDSWHHTVMTIDEYFNILRNPDSTPYAEIPKNYKVEISEGHLASVVADCIVYKYGTPKTHEINHFTLLKSEEKWQMVSVSFTATQVPEEEKDFDLMIFARSYARAWGSKRPGYVASYFAERGSLQVNDAQPALGRAEIATTAQSFMTKFPDMNVSFDRLERTSKGIEFHWTLTGTDADPEGKGHKVKVSGYELWTLGNDGRIKASLGNFPSDEYNRQLEFGI